MSAGSMHPTKETYLQLDRAFEHFNRHLFQNALPRCVITLQRHKSAYGYFWGDTWSASTGEKLSDEIALNPDHFRDRSLNETLSTLVHEMCHLQQHHFGKPSRKGYHNKEWAGMMEAVGLIPTDTGKEGGKRTGQRVTHMIEQSGAYAQACETLLKDGFSIPWQALTKTPEEEATAKKKRASKTKYTCPECGLNAWAKPNTPLLCGQCEITLEPEDHENEGKEDG